MADTSLLSRRLKSFFDPQGSPTLLSLPDSFVVTACAAIVVHLIFKRWEPMKLPIVAFLLFLVPACLSLLFASHLSLTKGLATAFATFYTVLVSSIVIYRISPFHPLARYPGPLAAKITKWWHAYHVHTGKQHLYVRRLHDQYGDIVRIGPNDVSIRDASCISSGLGSQGLPKGPMWDGRFMYSPIPAMVGARDHAYHMQRRRPWNRAFSATALKEYEPLIYGRVHQLVSALADRQGQVVDIAKWIGYFTYDFMGDMVYGGWTEMLRDGKDEDGLWDVVHRGLDVSAVYGEVPWVSYYASMLPNVGKDLKRMRKMAFDRAKQRYDSGSKARDLFYYLSNEDGAEKVTPPRPIVVSDGVLALIAGSDTTAIVTATILYSLLCNPTTYHRLQQEVDKFYPRGEDPLNPKHYKDMHYLEATINEGLRLFPATPSGTQRAPAPGKGDRLIGKYYIPEGTATKFHFWSIQRDPRNFSHPDTFWPERWLVAEGLEHADEPLTHNANAFVPFSFGPYNCVGKNVAMQEMRMLLCHLMHTLDLRFPEGYVPRAFEDALEDQFGFKVGELPVIVQRRE
uniref:High nitrogen upregulated cytochrome P450 monooxygenase 2 n=1 Tax=Phanerodontia chrysosporium TaxID=2822231 RepID=Q2VR02_PHACH|nr:high nitrogen upregulated cytochrome P450 monooxygenase 2 [Phanerodontia chrysosporium]